VSGTRSAALAVFLVATFGFVLSMFYRVSATVISPLLAEELGLNSMRLSTLSAAFFYSFAALQLPAGPAMDRLGPRKIMLLLGLLAAAGSLLFATADGYPRALSGRILMGLGMSVNLMGAFALIACWFPSERFATLAGVLTSAGTAGMLLAATPLAWLAETVGWRWAFVSVAALNLLQVGLLFLLVKDAPESRPPASSHPRLRETLAELARLWTRSWFWILNLASFFRFGAFMSLQGLLAGPYLIYGHGLSAIQTGNVLLACSIGYIIGLPLAGRLSDKTFRARRPVIAPGLLLTAALFALLSRLPDGSPMPAYLAVFFAIGLFSGPGNVVYAHVKELCPAEATATGMTGVNLFNMLGPAVLLQAGGALMPDRPAQVSGPEAFTPVWLLFASGLTLAGLLYLLAPESRPEAGPARSQ
jgi:MFS family permease